MSEIKLIRPTRTSYSAFKLWQRCPGSWKYKYIDKLPEAPSGPAAARGTRIHLAGERYMKGVIPIEQLPVEFLSFHDQLVAAQKMEAAAEAVWLCDADWNPVFPDADGTEPPTAWIKAVIDLSFVVEDTLHIVDYKSGRMYPDHVDQLELYAVMGAMRFPNVKQVEARAWYLDAGTEGAFVCHERPWLEALRGRWTERLCEMEADEKLERTPSVANCRFCSFGKSRGGPCELEFRDAQ